VILIVDDDEHALENVSLALTGAQANVLTASSPHKALQIAESTYCHVVITDVKMPGMDGITLAERIRNHHPTTKFIVVTGYANEDAVIRALRLGLHEFLRKPFHNAELLAAVGSLLEQHNLEEENRRLRHRLEFENKQLHATINALATVTTPEIIGSHPMLIHCLGLADTVASVGINALIQGETGTGKELLAQRIHARGPRSEGPFIAVNCAAVSSTLFESEFFGAEKGSYTGSTATRPGLFELANGGVLFLDEVTEIPTTMQAKLLRVIESGAVRRVGGSVDIPIDVQIISATNRPIHTAIVGGHLRTDLYHRLATVDIELPALRDRRTDILSLFTYFLEHYQGQFARNCAMPDKSHMAIIESATWPGNIRQLANVARRWVLFGPEQSLVSLHRDGMAPPTGSDDAHAFMRFTFVQGTFAEIEAAKHDLVHKAMTRYNGNKSAAARHLGLSYPGLLKVLRRMHDLATGTT
jgi:DNA-binding NtrC family response regulator